MAYYLNLLIVLSILASCQGQNPEWQGYNAWPAAAQQGVPDYGVLSRVRIPEWYSRPLKRQAWPAYAPREQRLWAAPPAGPVYQPYNSAAQLQPSQPPQSAPTTAATTTTNTTQAKFTATVSNTTSNDAAMQAKRGAAVVQAIVKVVQDGGAKALSKAIFAELVRAGAVKEDVKGHEDALVGEMSAVLEASVAAKTHAKLLHDFQWTPEAINKYLEEVMVSFLPQGNQNATDAGGRLQALTASGELGKALKSITEVSLPKNGTSTAASPLAASGPMAAPPSRAGGQQGWEQQSGHISPLGGPWLYSNNEGPYYDNVHPAIVWDKAPPLAARNAASGYYQNYQGQSDQSQAAFYQRQPNSGGSGFYRMQPERMQPAFYSGSSDLMQGGFYQQPSDQSGYVEGPPASSGVPYAKRLLLNIARRKANSGRRLNMGRKW